MKLYCSLVSLIGFCILASPVQAGTNRWDPLVALDSQIIGGPPTKASGAVFEGSNIAATTAQQSLYRRVALQSGEAAASGAAAKGVRTITAPQMLLILATDLTIPLGAESRWAGTLTSAASFRGTLPGLLKGWTQPDDPTLSLAGLAVIADFIEKDKVTTTAAWRFNVSPIPPSPMALRRARAKMKATGAKAAMCNLSVFEIRFIINVDGLGIPTTTLDELHEQLLKIGSDHAQFLKGIETLKTFVGNETNGPKYPGGMEMLNTAFPTKH